LYLKGKNGGLSGLGQQLPQARQVGDKEGRGRRSNK